MRVIIKIFFALAITTVLYSCGSDSKGAGDAKKEEGKVLPKKAMRKGL
ncbi:hypothetical protein KUH03_42515 [Sphingobacterium sp. E70]|nr:hypothetical protein [Sphingobacterium sp. E70]ULT25382.1 hypothetical protein KUH03_42515 [Sphingobacterium sp. E70]